MGEIKEKFIIKPTKEKDISIILKFREALFEESGYSDDSFISNAKNQLKTFYEEKYKLNRMQHFISYNSSGEPVAVVGALLKEDFPYFLFKPGSYGWIIDAYTKPEYRKRGVASKLLDANIQWLKEKGINNVKLLAFSEEAIRIYRNAGFNDVNVMELQI